MLLLALRFDRCRREWLWASLEKKSGARPAEGVKWARRSLIYPQEVR
jgi:hypothetical protein